MKTVKICETCSCNLVRVELKVCETCGWDFWLHQFFKPEELKLIYESNNQRKQNGLELQDSLNNLILDEKGLLEKTTNKNKDIKVIKSEILDVEKNILVEQKNFEAKNSEIEKLKKKHEHLNAELKKNYSLMINEDSLIKPCNVSKTKQIIIKYKREEILFKLVDGSKMPEILAVLEKKWNRIGIISNPIKCKIINHVLDSLGNNLWSLKIARLNFKYTGDYYLNFTSDIRSQSPYFLSMDGDIIKYKD